MRAPGRAAEPRRRDAHRRPGRRELLPRSAATAPTGADRRSRRGGRADPRRDRRDSAPRSRRSCSPTATSTTSAPSRRWPRRPARRSTAREIEVPVLADIMSFVPWPGFGPYESYEADETVAGGETLELAGLEIDVIFTPGHSPGHVTYSVRDEDAIFSGDVLFQGSVGRVDLPGGDGPTLLRVDPHAASTPTRPRPTSIPGHMGVTDAGRRAGDQPLPRRAGPVGAEAAAPVRSRTMAAASTRHRAGPSTCCPTAARARGRVEPTAAEIFARAGYEPDRDARLRGHRAVRARRRPVHRHRPQGDVHLRGQGRAQPHPAAGGHGADLPRLRRARHAQAGAAGEALPTSGRSSATSARRPAATASSTSSGPRRSAADSPLADAEVIVLLAELLAELGVPGVELRLGSLGSLEAAPGLPRGAEGPPARARGRALRRTCASGSTPTRCAPSTPTTRGRGR